MRSNLFWLSDEQWGKIEPLLPTDVRGKRARGRPAGDQWDLACAEERLPVVRLSPRVRPVDDHIQPLCALGAARCMGKPLPAACRERAIDTNADDRFYSYQGPPLGRGRKRGEQKQAIGRSRGGRNTKIHALSDAKGRLLSILVTGGQAHDRPLAERLIRRAKPAKKLLGDKAYDSAELRQWLADRGTKAVIPSLSNRKNPFSYDKRSYKQRHRVENAICRLKDFRRIATRYDRFTKLPGSGLPGRCYRLVDFMSLDPNKVPEVEQVEQSAAEQDASEEDDEDSGQDDEAADTNEAEDDEEEAATPVARLKQEVARLEQELTAANKKLKDKEYVDQELAQVPQKLDAVDHLNKRLAKRAEHLERNHIKAGMTRVEIADAFFRQLAENAPEEAEGALAEVASRVQAKAAAPEQPAPEPTAEAPAEQQAAVEQPAAEQTAAEQTDLLDIPAFLRRQAKTAEPTEEAPAEQVAVEPEPPGASDARLSRSSQEEPLVPSSQGEAPPQTYWPSKPKRRPAIHTHRFAGRYETLKDGEIYCEPSDAHAEDWVILRYDRLQEGGKTQWLPVKKYSSREEAKADWAAFIARMKSSVMAEELAAEEPELVSS